MNRQIIADDEVITSYVMKNVLTLKSLLNEGLLFALLKLTKIGLESGFSKALLLYDAASNDIYVFSFQLSTIAHYYGRTIFSRVLN